MGIYLNPGNTMFRQALRSKIYVDKTELIAYANEVLDTEQKISVSAARAGLANQWRHICFVRIMTVPVILMLCSLA